MKKLIPVLETVFERDQIRMLQVKKRSEELDQEIQRLSAMKRSKFSSSEPHLMRQQERYIDWVSGEIEKLKKSKGALEPELREARDALKLSFGRLEAARKIVAESSV
ncbi:hypothetical protein [Litoreibacter ponti]|uniref:hypothetical protein n=1 Tax=Litoreibacter ponti TaxID=1510457 RepID=UPI000D326062|nr:hypothetical protein [Litoreibacter ponti]